MPSRNLAPSGITSTNFHSSSGNVTPMSLPYAPVSSDVSHISTQPSKMQRHHFDSYS